MLIETTTRFHDKDEAEDSLEGLSTLPTFYVGYVRSNPDQSFEVITVFDCIDIDSPTEKLPRQKPVVAFTVGSIARDVIFYDRTH
jgi:hypothetical protein